MPQTAKNIDPETWGTENTWFDWTADPSPYPYSFNRYSSSMYQHFKAAEMKSPYYYKSTYNTDEINETYRVQWRGVWVYDFYHSQNDPEPIFKSNVAIETKQWPTPWGFGLNSPMSNTFSVFPAYDVGAYESGNQFPEAMVTYFWTSLTENFGPQPAIFKPGEDWGTETDSSKTHKPMPFIPCFEGTNNDNISYKQRNQNCYTYSDTSVGSPNYIPLSFNYQKIVVVPCVYCAKEDDTYDYGIKFGGKKTLQQYFDGVNWDPETQTGTPPAILEYPLITSVVLDRIYFGDTTETAQGRRYIDGTNLNSLLPDKLTTGSIPSTLIKINGTYTLKGSKWGEVGNENNWLPAKGYSVAIGTISGMGDTKNGARIQGMTINTSINDLRKAYIMATQSDTATVNLFHQNGDYEIYIKQKRTSTGSTYGYQFGMTSIWRNPTKEKVLRDVAYLGFWFADDYDTAATALTGENCDSSKMHIPIFDSEGLTTGEYKSGTDAALEDNAKWQDPFKDNDKYNPNKGEVDDGDTGDLDSSIPIRGSNTAGLKLWVVSQSDLYSINAYLNGTYLPDITQSTADFKGSNPQEYIVSIQQYPFSLPHFPTKDYIHIGKLNTGVEGYPFTYTQGVINDISIVDFGSLSIPYYFNDFRDFESTIVIQLPFIGAYELDPRVYIGHTVSLKYNIDYTTGSVCAMIYRDSLIVETYTGNISISVPLFATNMGAYQNTLASLQFAVDQSKTKQIAGIAATALSIGGALAAIPTGGMSALAAAGIAGGLISGASSMVSGLIQQQELEYKIDHTQPHTASVSTASAANSFLLDDRARLLIYRPRMLNYDDAVYSHTVGNACCLTGVVGDFEGLIKCGNVDLSGIPATADEIKAIGDALASGVYV